MSGLATSAMACSSVGTSVLKQHRQHPEPVRPGMMHGLVQKRAQGQGFGVAMGRGPEIEEFDHERQRHGQKVEEHNRKAEVDGALCEYDETSP